MIKSVSKDYDVESCVIRFFQRAGGWCEPVKPVAVCSHRVGKKKAFLAIRPSPFCSVNAFKRRFMRKLSGTAGMYLVSSFLRRDFLILSAGRTDL